MSHDGLKDVVATLQGAASRLSEVSLREREREGERGREEKEKTQLILFSLLSL